MNSTRDPWLSVIIPTFNGGPFLAQALASIVAQDVQGIEVVAVDDGSTDETLEILESWSGRFAIRVERRAHGGNWVENANLALDLSRGEFVSILHQDDYWLPGRVVALRRMLSEHSDAVAAFHPVRLVDDRGRRLGTWSAPLRAYPASMSSPELIDRLLIQNFIGIVAPLFRRTTAIQMGGLSPELWYAADWDFWLKLANCGPFLYAPEVLAGFRIHGASQTLMGRDDPGEIRRQLEAVFTNHVAQASSGDVSLTGRFSIEVNVFLFGGLRNGSTSVGRLLRLGALLGFRGWMRYFRDSRILERVCARARERLRKEIDRLVRL